MNVAVHSQQNFISLFAGAGGLDLAVGLALPDARCVCYVEREIEAAGILEARMRDEALDDAPIWSDVSTFDGKPWRGLVDGIAGGFPCQDLSVAGKREGIQRGNRSGLFYEYVRIIRESEPRWVYIENVPAVLAFPAGGIVLGELAAMGFDAEWGTLRAREVGASHQRKRCFVLAYRAGGRWIKEWAESTRLQRGFDAGERVVTLAHADGERRGEARRLQCGEESMLAGTGADVDDATSARLRTGLCSAGGDICDETWRTKPCGRCDVVVDAECTERWPQADRAGSREPWSDGEGQAAGGAGERSVVLEDSGCNALRRCAGCREEACGRSCTEVAGPGAELGNADDSRLEIDGRPGGDREASPATARQASERAGSDMGFVFAPGPTAEIWNDVLVRDYGMRPALSQAEAESCLRRVADGLASPLDQRIDRLRACGNGVVAIQGAAALIELVRRAGGR